MNNSGRDVDFDLNKVYNVPGIENLIFSYVNFDKCRKEIIRFENKRNSVNMNTRQPKDSKTEALDVLRCHS